MPASRRRSGVFDVINHLNGAVALATDEERLAGARLNLVAAKESKKSLAYAVAVGYLQTGAELLGSSGWQTQRELMWDITLETADCELLLANADGARDRLRGLREHAQNASERAEIQRRLAVIALGLGRLPESIAEGLEGLKQLDFHIDAHPSPMQVRLLWSKVRVLLAVSDAQKFADMTAMTDQHKLQISELLASCLMAAFYTNPPLFDMVSLHVSYIAIRYGTSPMSAYAYAVLSLQIMARMRNYQLASTVAQAAYKVTASLSTTLNPTFSLLIPLIFVEHVDRYPAQMRSHLERAYAASVETGDHALGMVVINHFLNVRFRTDLLENAETCAQYERSYRPVRLAHGQYRVMTQSTRCLLGETDGPLSYNDANFNDSDFDKLIVNNKTWVYYCGHRAFVHLLHGDVTGAHQLIVRAHTLDAWQSMSGYDAHLPRFASALVMLAEAIARGVKEVSHPEILKLHMDELQTNARCGHAYRGEYQLLMAQQAFMQGDAAEAARLIDAAIVLLEDSDYAPMTALGYECAARILLASKKVTAAQGYCMRAIEEYRRWGAVIKVRQLENEWNAGHRERGTHHTKTGTNKRKTLHDQSRTHASGEFNNEGDEMRRLLEASQALSGEVVLEKLNAKVLAIMRGTSGADRVVIALRRGDAWAIAADTAAPNMSEEKPAAGDSLPLRVLTLVGETVRPWCWAAAKSTILKRTRTSGRSTPNPWSARPSSISSAVWELSI